jgi:hypothetical protein
MRTLLIALNTGAAQSAAVMSTGSSVNRAIQGGLSNYATAQMNEQNAKWQNQLVNRGSIVWAN